MASCGRELPAYGSNSGRQSCTLQTSCSFAIALITLFPVMAAAPQPNFLLCQLCGGPVALESCKTDENGKAVHDECYAKSLAEPESTEHGLFQRPECVWGSYSFLSYRKSGAL